MNFKNIVSGIWKLFVYGTGNGEKQYDIWLPISNFLKEETVFINPSSEQTVTSPEMHSMLSPMQHMMWQQVVCTSGPAKDIQETEGLFQTSQHREYQ